jgi:hypothetical protein
MDASTISAPRSPWNKDKLVGQKRPFKLKEIWAIRTRRQLSCRTRDLALFNLGRCRRAFSRRAAPVGN